MRIVDAINRIDSLMHNTYNQGDKVSWLSRVDSMVKRHIIDTHENGEDVVFIGYDDSTDIQKVLLMPEPYDEAYLSFIEAQIHYYNGEYEKYNNAMDMFNTVFQSYKNYYNRTHMPKGREYKYF